MERKQGCAGQEELFGRGRGGRERGEEGRTKQEEKLQRSCTDGRTLKRQNGGKGLD